MLLIKATGLGIATNTSTILSMNRTWWISTVLLDYRTLSLKRPPLGVATLFGWGVLGVATHCHINDSVDVLALWDLHGSLYFLNQKDLSLHLHRNVHNLIHSSLLDSFTTQDNDLCTELFRREVDIVLWA